MAAGRVAAATALALLAAGCVGGPLGALLPSGPITTGSISPGSIARTTPLTLGLDTRDWARAEEALAVALDPLGAGAEVAWANPQSRTTGVVAPAGAPRLEGDLVCRAFAARTDRADGASERHEGRACRLSAGRWRVEEARRAEDDGRRARSW